MTICQAVGNDVDLVLSACIEADIVVVVVAVVVGELEPVGNVVGVAVVVVAVDNELVRPEHELEPQQNDCCCCCCCQSRNWDHYNGDRTNHHRIDRPYPNCTILVDGNFVERRPVERCCCYGTVAVVQRPVVAVLLGQRANDHRWLGNYMCNK